MADGQGKYGQPARHSGDPGRAGVSVGVVGYSVLNQNVEAAMFEIGQRVVCVKPVEETWFGDVPIELRPKNVPESGGVYTIRDIVTGSPVPGGPHWTKAPGLIGLVLEEIINEPRFTTNGGDGQEQAFHEDNFMPLQERQSPVQVEEVMTG